MCIWEDKARELIEERGVLSTCVLMRKFHISYEYAKKIYYTVQEPIKNLKGKKVMKYVSHYSKRFWKSRKDWII